ncbi:class I histocompatibility antigen F10 alpha chain-like [Crotalus adamanteus]|uniref:Class I histocompatibility antigen F10 alpha chain-like n=1 Tax=Crotalus adamanteus TaxID=8729 RepID=A0AAW1BTS2_CROAD
MRGGIPGRGFPDGTFAFLSPPPSLELRLDVRPATMTTWAYSFFPLVEFAQSPAGSGLLRLLIDATLSLAAASGKRSAGGGSPAGMALRSAPLLLLVLVTVASQESRFGNSSHSLKYFYTSISDSSQESPHFVVLGYVDSQVFAHYDSNIQKFQPRVSWIEKVEKEDPQYWEKYTEILRDNEKLFKKDLEKLKTRYNHSNGLHTWQNMVSCTLQGNRSRGLWQYGYQGRTFIAFDEKTFTWVASDLQAQVTQRDWNANPRLNPYIKTYLMEECIAWLKKFLSYGNETLLRTDPPEVTMSSRTEVEDGMETHVCRLDGFYPREIDVSWRRDGEVWLQDTLRGSVAPNADGTFHAWLSIQIDPKERGRYRCHVEHDSLKEPLDVALKEPKSNLGIIIISCVVAGLVLLGVIAVGILVFLKRRQGDHRAALRSEEGSNNSDQGSIASTQAMLQPSCSRLRLDLCLATVTTWAQVFFYWLSLTNHPLLVWFVALLITRSASFSACGFWRADRSSRIAARMALRSLPLLVLVGVALRESCLGESLCLLVGIHPRNLSSPPQKIVAKEEKPNSVLFRVRSPSGPSQKGPQSADGTWLPPPLPPRRAPLGTGQGGALQRSVKSTWAPPSAVLSLPQSGGCGKAAFAGTGSVPKLPGCLRTTPPPA